MADAAEKESIGDLTTKKLDDLAKSIHDARDAANKGNEEKFQKFADESADRLTEIHKIKDIATAQAKTIKELEIQIARAPAGTKIETVPPQEYTECLNKFLRRKSTPVADDIMKNALDWSLKHSKALPMNGVKEGREIIRKDMLEGINPRGGYWILPEHSPQDVEKFYETNPMRQICNVQTTGTNVMKMIIDDDLSTSGGWVGETAARASTDTARIGELNIPIHEQFAEPKASNWMLDDVTFNLVSWITNKTTQILNLYENSSFIAGDGAQKPKGVLAYEKWGGAAVDFGNDSNYQRNALEYIKSGVAGQVTYDGYVNIQLSLLENYQPGAIWLMTRQAWADTLKVKDDQNRPLYQLANLLATGANQVLLGKDVRLAAPTNMIKQAGEQVSLPGLPVPAVDSASVIYGDFNEGYTIVDRIGFMTIQDIYTEKQYVKYYTRKRLGGALSSYQSLKVLQLSA